jgi:hypothetical protein
MDRFLDIHGLSLGDYMTSKYLTSLMEKRALGWMAEPAAQIGGAYLFGTDSALGKGVQATTGALSNPFSVGFMPQQQIATGVMNAMGYDRNPYSIPRMVGDMGGAMLVTPTLNAAGRVASGAGNVLGSRALATAGRAGMGAGKFFGNLQNAAYANIAPFMAGGGLEALGHTYEPGTVAHHGLRTAGSVANNMGIASGIGAALQGSGVLNNTAGRALTGFSNQLGRKFGLNRVLGMGPAASRFMGNQAMRFARTGVGTAMRRALPTAVKSTLGKFLATRGAALATPGVGPLLFAGLLAKDIYGGVQDYMSINSQRTGGSAGIFDWMRGRTRAGNFINQRNAMGATGHLPGSRLQSNLNALSDRGWKDSKQYRKLVSQEADMYG